MGTFLGYRSLHEVTSGEMTFHPKTEKDIQMREMYALRNILTPNQINLFFANSGYIAPYYFENIRDQLYHNHKDISLNEDLWRGINPFFPENLKDLKKN